MVWLPSMVVSPSGLVRVTSPCLVAGQRSVYTAWEGESFASGPVCVTVPYSFSPTL